MKNGDLNAYPQVFTTEDGDIGSISGGLSKREHFAAMAMQGILSSCFASMNPQAEDLAQDALNYADALLIELENKK